MLVQIVGLSVVLVATLIILFVCISGNINLKMEVDKLKSTLRPSDMDYIKDTVVARKTVEFIKGNANLQ